jgi:hypothetical protein
MDPINTDSPWVIRSFCSPSPSLPHWEGFMAVMSDDAAGDASDDAGSMNGVNPILQRRLEKWSCQWSPEVHKFLNIILR